MMAGGSGKEFGLLIATGTADYRAVRASRIEATTTHPGSQLGGQTEKKPVLIHITHQH